MSTTKNLNALLTPLQAPKAVILWQLLLGAVLIFSGVAKSIDPLGTAIKVGEYAVSFGIPLSNSLALTAAVLLNIIEATLGIMLLTGMLPRVASRAVLWLMVPLTLLTLYIYIFNPVADCGCFGDAIKLSNASTFWKNIILLAMAVLLHRNYHHMWQLVRSSRYQTFLALGSAGVLYLVNLYPIEHLPAIDFRPYKVGSSLYELTIGGAEEGEYQHLFVYERNGEERTFTLEEIAELDDSWQYLRDATIEVKAPKLAPGADFVLTYEDGTTPMAELMEENSGYTLLYILPSVTENSEEALQLGADLQRLVPEPVWLVTGESWQHLAEHPLSHYLSKYSKVLFLDRSTAITVIRSQPGLVVLKDGYIIRKISGKDLDYLLLETGDLAHIQLLAPTTRGEIKAKQRMAFAPLVIWGVALAFIGVWDRRKRKNLKQE